MSYDSKGDPCLIAAAPDQVSAGKAPDEYQCGYERSCLQPGCLPADDLWSERAVGVVRAAPTAIAKAEGRETT